MSEERRERLTPALAILNLRKRVRIFGIIVFAFAVFLIAGCLLLAWLLREVGLANFDVLSLIVCVSVSLPIEVLQIRRLVEAHLLVRRGHFRLVEDTLDYTVPRVRRSPSDSMSLEMVFSDARSYPYCVTEYWFHTYGCVAMPASDKSWTLAGRRYYLVVCDEVAYMAFGVYDATRYEVDPTDLSPHREGDAAEQ